MFLNNIDLNFYPSLKLNYKFSADGQLCIPAGPIIYILSNSILNPDLVSAPPVPSKFKPGDESKVDFRTVENRPDGKRNVGKAKRRSVEDSESEEEESGSDEDGEERKGEEDEQEEKARPEFQWHYQKLELLEEKEED